MQTKMFLKIGINALALLFAFVSLQLTAQNQIELSVCLGEQVFLEASPTYPGPLGPTGPMPPPPAPSQNGYDNGSAVCGVGSTYPYAGTNQGIPEPLYYCHPSSTTLIGANVNDTEDENGWFVSPLESTTYVLTTNFLTDNGSSACQSQDLVYNVTVEDCAPQAEAQSEEEQASNNEIDTGESGAGNAAALPNCSEQGTIFFALCDDGVEYFFIEMTNGTIIDPYYGPGVAFNHYDGQLVDFSYSATFDSPCSLAAMAVTIDCIQETPIDYNFNWASDFPFLANTIAAPCDGVSVEAYAIGNGTFWIVVNTPENGTQLFYEDGTLYCTGNTCLSSYGISGAPVDTFNCGDIVIPADVVERTICQGSSIYLSPFNPEANLPPFGLNACYPSTTVSPSTNGGSQSFIPEPNTIYTVTTVIEGPTGTSCGFFSPGMIFTYQVIVLIEDCEACPDPGNCSDGLCYNGTEVWNFADCACEVLETPCSENASEMTFTICAGEQILAPQLPGPMVSGFCNPASMINWNNTIEPLTGVSGDATSGYVLSPTVTTTYVITNTYGGPADGSCPSNLPVTLLLTVNVNDCGNPPTQEIDVTICEGGTYFISVESENGVCNAPNITVVSSNPSETIEMPWSGLAAVSPTETTSYTATGYFDLSSGNCGDQLTRTVIYNVSVVDCNIPDPVVVNQTICWGSSTILDYPEYTPAPGPGTCYPTPTIEPAAYLYNPCAFCPPLDNAVEVRPIESTTYELSLGDLLVSTPGCNPPPSIIYNITVELCDLSEFEIANNGSTNTTTCQGENVLVGPYTLSDAIVCPGPMYSFSPEPLGTYFSPAGTGSQVYFLVNPTTTTTYTFIDTPGCEGDTPQTTTVNVESCTGLQEITICQGEQIQLNPPTAIPLPFEIGFQCTPSTGQASASNGDPVGVYEVVTPMESTVYTVTTFYANGTDQPFNCQNETITYNVTVEDCSTPPQSLCYDASALYPTAECEAYGYDPVCSCDNITYNNICEAFYLNGITSYTAGACIGEPTTCPDPGNCDDGICENGIESWNELTCVCETTITDCVGPPIPAGCVDPSIIISNIDCQSYAYEPVCGCDDVSYYNSCEAYWYNGVTSYTNGACPDSPINPPTEPPVQPGCYDANVLYDIDCSNDAYDPVCGCDNQTYNNICEAFYQNGITSYTLGACPNGYIETVDLFDERGVPFLICHEGLNRLGAEVISQSVTGLECGKINFVEGICFQYLPYGDCATEEVRVSWVDENGLTESRDYKIVISEEQESVGIGSVDGEELGIEVLYGDAGNIWIQQTKNSFDEIDYAVYSINGQLQMQSSSSDNRWMIDTSILVKGMYVIKSSVGSARFVVR